MKASYTVTLAYFSPIFFLDAAICKDYNDNEHEWIQRSNRQIQISEP